MRSEASLTVSPLSALCCAVTFLVGLAMGALTSTSSSLKTVEHNPEQNAILLHWTVGAFVLVLILIVSIHTKSLRWIMWPLSTRLSRRFALTFRVARSSVLGTVRIAGAVALAAFILYFVFRIGFQTTVGLNPVFVINAWGGPTSIGAFAAHGVDAIACIALTSVLLHTVLRRS